jgi:hypothetical protein
MTVGLWRDDRHRYYAHYPDHDGANGTAMPGVTSVIAKVDKSGPLIAWAKGVTADAALDNLDSLSVRVKEDGRAPTKAWLTAKATAESDAAKDLGSRIHVLAEQIERGANPDVSEDALPYVAGYRAFRDDFGPTFKSLEQFTANLTLGYGGTFDWLAIMDLGHGPKLTLGDTKTSTSGPRRTRAATSCSASTSAKPTAPPSVVRWTSTAGPRPVPRQGSRRARLSRRSQHEHRTDR